MESDIRKAIAAGTGGAVTGEKSPAGSVKRARERAAAGLPPEHPAMPEYSLPLVTSSSKQSPQLNSSLVGNNSLIDNHQDSLQSSGQTPSVSREPPQRPPRPNDLPPILHPPEMQHNKSSPLQYAQPQAQELQQNYWEDDGGSSRPLTQSSESTTVSITDFPPTPSIPVLQPPTFQPPPRRNLGPPPSSRKGGSSYYSQNSFVPPIPEEVSDTHSSYASSHVMPESWPDGPPEFYMGSGIEEEEEEEEDISPGGNSGRASSAGDHDDASGLVRHGSHGRSRGMSLETVESGDESDIGERRRRELTWQARQDERWRTGAGSAGTDPIGRHNFRNQGRLQNPYSGYESDATFLDSPRSSMPPPMPRSNQFQGTSETNSSPIDPRVGEILGHLEKGGALASSGTVSPDPISHEKGLKRPPRLNLDGQKEPRGSASSLPELIRRATKLASNLDRGKTASRIGMLELLNRKEEEKEKEKAAKGGSISDILAAFPSPSPTTPTHHKPSGWPGSPSPHGKSTLSRTQTVKYGSQDSNIYRSRRCCGMPVWVFILLMIIVLLLIAAAIIIPVTLIVLPKQHKNNEPSLSDCKSSNPCAHGGTSVVVNKECRCICANSFSGSRCNAASDGACATTDINVPNAASYRNATLGSDITRILTSAQPNFSIPIVSFTLLTLFSAKNLSCSAENALITFNGRAQRRNLLFADLPSHHLSDKLLRNAIPLGLEEVLSPIRLQSAGSPVLKVRGAAQSSNGIIFEGPSSTGGAAAPSATATAKPTTSNTKPITQNVLDFARTAVLFILQETSDLTSAAKALEALQTTLSSGTDFDITQTSAGGNITVDLSAFTVGFGNGTLYGGKAATS